MESSASAPAVGDGYGYGRGSGANRVPIGLASGGGGGMTGTTPRPISGGASGGGTETEALALGNEGGKWLEGLVWDPRIDGSESAKKMVMRRREEVGQGGGEVSDGCDQCTSLVVTTTVWHTSDGVLGWRGGTIQSSFCRLMRSFRQITA